MRTTLTLIYFSLLALVMPTHVMAQGFQLPNMQVTSDAFEDGGIIPIKYTSHGEMYSPILQLREHLRPLPALPLSFTIFL